MLICYYSVKSKIIFKQKNKKLLLLSILKIRFNFAKLHSKKFHHFNDVSSSHQLITFADVDSLICIFEIVKLLVFFEFEFDFKIYLRTISFLSTTMLLNR